MRNNKCRISKYVSKQTEAISLSSYVKCQCLILTYLNCAEYIMMFVYERAVIKTQEPNFMMD
jgi:hypothetical protein